MCAILMGGAHPSFAQQHLFTLDECRQMALQNNIKVRNQKLSIEQAGETEKEMRAKYLPTVKAGAGYFHADRDIVKASLDGKQINQLGNMATAMGIDAVALSGIPTSLTLLDHGLLSGVMAMLPVYAGGQIHNANKLAKVNSEVQNLIMRQTTDEIIQTTESYFYQLSKLYENQHTIITAQKQVSSIEKDAELAVKVGVKLKGDLLSVKLRKDELSSDSLKLENGIALCRLVLAQYVGAEDVKAFDIVRSFNENIRPATDYLVNFNDALSNRAEAALLDKNVAAASLQTKLKRGAMLPTLAVGAAGTYYNFDKGRANIMGMATLSIPISAWWSDNKGVKKARLAEQQAMQTRTDNRQKLLIQMQSAYNDLDNAYKQTLIARQSVTTSEENLRLNQNYYRAGSSTMTDLLNAQTSNRMANNKLAEAKADYMLALTKYLKAIGK